MWQYRTLAGGLAQENWSRPQRTQASAFDPRETLRNEQVLLTPQASFCGVRMAFSMPGEPVLIKADPVKMEQVVFNLARNAIEAVQGQAVDGHVGVSLKREHERVVLDVPDNGPGIAPEMRDKLLNRNSSMRYRRARTYSTPTARPPASRR